MFLTSLPAQLAQPEPEVRGQGLDVHREIRNFPGSTDTTPSWSNTLSVTIPTNQQIPDQMVSEVTLVDHSGIAAKCSSASNNVLNLEGLDLLKFKQFQSFQKICGHVPCEHRD